MKKRMLSFLVAALAFAVCTTLTVVIFRGMAARDRLESQNDGERTISALLSSLRNYDDFGTAIENTPQLKAKVVSVSVFGGAKDLLYAWGNAPRIQPAQEPAPAGEAGQMGELYVENPKDSSMIILLRPPQPRRPPPEGPGPAQPNAERPDTAQPNADRPNAERLPGARHESSFLSDTLRNADLIVLEVHQAEYWQRKRLQGVLFPVVEVLLAAAIAFVCFLVLKNSQYRANAEQQKNLVLLGTAASTLAHEIKNPLLSIRLQTGILSRVLAGNGARELAIIDDEVNRLSLLSTRVNDILRDPTGQPQAIDPLDIASEVGARLCGRPIVTCADLARTDDRRVLIDPERLRSIVENLVRNALESGGPQDAVALEISPSDGAVCIDVLDRGAGIPAKSREQVFDPFFTTKSRGTGIGLVICRRFALAAGGNITLEDRPGGGTRARLYLPRRHA